MAYEASDVPVERSQAAIRQMVYDHKGSGIMFVSQRPLEGFEAMVTLRGKPYHVRITANSRPPKMVDRYGHGISDIKKTKAWAAEERRIWRVLYFHLKSMFEAIDSDVLSVEQVILPFVVTRDGRTISEHLVGQLDQATQEGPVALMLPS